MNLQNRKGLRDTVNKHGCQGGRWGGRDREFGMDMYTLWDGHVHTAVFKMGNQQGPAV